ncbi:MAG: DNA-directed RNA polymerase subunit beta' [Minisyncoccia bacterium]
MNQNLKSISIKIASPEEILSWSHGEVLRPETINYRTQKPEKDGLFSERIFGPTKDYECYCGKYKKIRYKGVVCEKCGVEVTRSSVRRERMGHINLAAPVAHIWFLRTVPSKLSLLLNIPLPKLERVIYYASYIVTKINEENKERVLKEIKKESEILKKGKTKKEQSNIATEEENILDVVANLNIGTVLTEQQYLTLAEKFADVFEADRGAGAVRKILENLDLKKEVKQLKDTLRTIKDPVHYLKILKKIKLLESFIKNKARPEWMILTVLPVLPPDLRPMVPLDGGRYATADLNDLYRRVINRNNRLKKLIELKAPEVIIINEKRMLQEAVDALIDNSAHANNPIVSSRKRPLKSLADMLGGKQGRFRQNLLGKRVDYSGRSVIVIGPELKLNECGLPKIMALEMFKPFVINKILEKGLALNIKTANRLIEQAPPEVWAILEDIIQNKRVLLNRAPTLHRLGIQSFKPILIEDLAIKIPAMVCTAFNADFDGDQMAVHLPLTPEAQYEAITLMDAGKNLLKPANNEPIITPSKDMVLGCYFLTFIKSNAKADDKIYSSFSEVEYAYENKFIDINTLIKFYLEKENKIIETSYGRLIFNNVLPTDYPFVNQTLNSKALSKIVGDIINRYGIDKSQVYLDAIKDLGFYFSTVSAATWSIYDLPTISSKQELIQKAEQAIENIFNEYEEGLLTDEERHQRVIDVWEGTREEVAKLVTSAFNEDNPIGMIIHSGARGNVSQANQMIGIKGIVVNPKNEQIELPIKSSYKEGFSVIEYFISTHGARKGLSDTALKTASAGYLTRRMVDVAQDVTIKIEDCGTKEGIKIYRKDSEEINIPLATRLLGRTALEDIIINKNVVVKANEIINKEQAEIIQQSKLEFVKVRSPITCKALDGLCIKCFGLDLATNKPVKIGESVGIVAAQSIGEPGTQLTLRSFHAGGISGLDITQGLPRVEELLEARTPKGKAPLIVEDGVVDDILEKGSYRVVRVVSKDKKNKDKVKEYLISKRNILTVNVGDKVKKGQEIGIGSLDLKEILAYRGVEDLERYIINEIQKVYTLQAVNINDKYIEILVRKMLSKVEITDPGDTDLLPKDIIDKTTLIKINREIKEQKGQPAKAIQKVFGIKYISLNTESFLSAASFQETPRVLVNAALKGKVDELKGLKENVIIGRLIPAGTGLNGITKEQLKEFQLTLNNDSDIVADNNVENG